MRAASELLRRHLRHSFRFLSPPVHPLPSASPSNFYSNIPFHRRNFAANRHYPTSYSPLFSNFIAHRAFSWFTWRNSVEIDKREEDSSGSSEERLELNPMEVLETAPELPSISSTASSQISEDVFGENTWYYYPIQAVISMLDGFHDFTGLPWWVVISVSTLALRVSLLPVLVLQLKKMSKFGALLPRLPPPFPPPRSERSFREQYQLFHKKRRELGCPSYLWNFAFFTAQLPCFLLWMSSIRRMCLDHHPGFDSGGTLWFLNLTEYPSGLPNLMDPVKKRVSTENEHDSAATSEILIPIEAVPPDMLLELALKDMAAGDQDKALILLRKTLEKDPELVQALVAVGQILCSKKLFEEAAENFELAIPKLSFIKEEEIGLLVLSLFGAGVSRIWQGRNLDGIAHLKKIAELREPDSPMDKACYYRGLVMLGSTLFQLGEKSEAAKYLRIAANYDPGVNAYLKECEEG